MKTLWSCPGESRGVRQTDENPINGRARERSRQLKLRQIFHLMQTSGILPSADVICDRGNASPGSVPKCAV